MEGNPKHLYSFNGFHLETVERVLRRGDQTVPIPPKVLDVLVELVENHGHIVEKEKLLERVWPETFVEEGAIAQSIFTLRKLLGDTPEGHAFIETVPRRGYRFVAPVEELKDELASRVKLREENSKVAPQAGLRLWRLPAAAIVLILILAGLAWRREDHRGSTPPGKIMLAVLPFENLSGDSREDYLSVGLSEEMITQLAILEPSRLGVIAVSATQFKGPKKNPRDIGRELRVDYILQGSLRREGDKLRVTAQLFQVNDQTHVWAKDYDRNMRNILALQSDVTGAIAREINLKLTPEVRARLASPLSIDAEAYELYMKGRYFWNKRNEDGFVKAIGYFDKAITREPKYAQAYAGLADAYAFLGSLPNEEIRRDDAMPKAKAAALHAIQLDDSLAEAHTSLAFVEMQYEWDWQGSEQEFKRALELNPKYATAHQWYAIWLIAQGKPAAALEQERMAQEADPLSLIIKTDTAQLLECWGHYDEAAQQAQRALEIDPNFVLARLYLGNAYAGKQDYPAAITEFQRALATSKRNMWVLPALARAYALAGDRRKSKIILQNILDGAKNESDVADGVGAIYAALGNKDQAFSWLEKAYHHHSGGLILLGVAPEYESLHGDPRFKDLLHRVGLPADNSSTQ